ncbi:MAG: pyridoxal-dependent decarboxylase [Bacteroidales bacterium]|jgi:glutamate/tyrosine decarboxylase-like PLP-dependent enzyme|nr:pyridoxal-dependent decarboxylase [Bacteroidales bacterium]
MNTWNKLSKEQINKRVFEALSQNVNYHTETILGVPGSNLDDRVFYSNADFLKDAPFLSTMISNPNHIGCHTLDASESFFKGTHTIERELIDICSSDMLKAEPGSCDGYVASGGTEANMQAIWIYRNYFVKEFGAKNSDIVILCSEDRHYSMDKAGNVFCLDVQLVDVDRKTREITEQAVVSAIAEAKQKGKKYFIVVANMMTTMFGSVDHIERYIDALKTEECNYKIHVDGAFGGFYYPFTIESHAYDFSNPEISSFTLDAHKMAQAPYGTGIFLIRKGFMQYANTDAAKYVEGEDYTLIGSRSGANAIAVWMILMTHGPFGWQEKIFILQKRTDWMCNELKALGIDYYRHPQSNLITINANQISDDIAKEFWLVPDNHDKPEWFKIVVMDHVTIDRLSMLIDRIKATR